MVGLADEDAVVGLDVGPALVGSGSEVLGPCVGAVVEESLSTLSATSPPALSFAEGTVYSCAMGEEEGPRVGVPETGEVLGLRVGAPETGGAVGPWVGASETGEAVGPRVGASETSEAVVGPWVGLVDTGAVDGILVGAALLGKAVGPIVGVLDGVAIGEFSMEC